MRIHYNTARPYKAQGRRIMRLKPRFNEFVNKFWMCDEGRYNYKWIDLQRLQHPMVHEEAGLHGAEWDLVLSSVAEELRKTIEQHGPGSVGVIASPQMTNEELYLLRKVFFEHLQVPLLPYFIPPKKDATEDNFLIKKDKNPNTKGADLILGEQKSLPVEAVLNLARDGRLKCLYIFHSNLIEDFGAERVKEALNKVDTVIYHGTNESEIVKFATYVIASATYAEKEGTFTNFQGRVQRIFPAIAPLGNSRPTLEILAEIGKQVGAGITSSAAADVFAELSTGIPAFAGMDYNTIGLSGRLVQTTPEPAVAAD